MSGPSVVRSASAFAAALAVGLTLSSLEGRSFSLKNHSDITDTVLRSIVVTYGARDYRFSDRAIREIVDANESVDDTHTAALLSDWRHFTGEEFFASSRSLIDFKLDITVYSATDSWLPPVPSKARSALGKALHVLQDFYSHSTYPEFARDNGWGPIFQSQLGRTILTAPPLAFQPCPNDANDVAFASNGGVSSAYYSDLYGCRQPAAGKCVHGNYPSLGQDLRPGGADESNYCRGINKDMSQADAAALGLRPSDYDDDDFLTAYQMAKDATRDYVHQVLDDLRGDEAALASFMDVEPDVAFVIDNSTSMENDLAQVKSLVLDMAHKSVAGDATPHRLWLTVFNDPDTGTPVAYSALDDFAAAVNAIALLGGGTDCPEPSKAAILKTLDALSPRATLHFFTDAQAKDDSLSNDIDARTEAKQIVIHSNVYPDTCAGGRATSFDGVTEASGGQALKLGHGEFAKVMPAVEARMQGVRTRVLAQNLSVGAPGVVSRRFPVDAAATRLLVQAAGSSLSGLSLTSPSGRTLSATSPDVLASTYQGGRFLLVSRPESGAWRLDLSGTGSMGIDVSTDSRLELWSADFVRPSGDLHGGLVPTRAALVPGSIVTLRLALLGNSRNVTLRTEDLQGNTLGIVPRVAPRPVDNQSDILGTLAVPAVPFRLRVMGTDASGFPFQRTYPTAFRPSAVSIEPVEIVREAAPGSQMTVEFTVRNLTGATGTFDVTATAAVGISGQYSPTVLSLGSNQTGTVRVSITLSPQMDPSSPAAVGASVSLRSNPAVFDSSTADIVVEHRRLRGRVADIVDGGVGSVTVTARGPVTRTALTDGDGRFSFEGLPAGFYSLSASGSGLTIAPATTSVSLGTANLDDITFQATSAFGTLGFRRYFAEGATSAFFDTTFAVFNPSPLPSTVRMSFLRKDSVNVVEEFVVPPSGSVRLVAKESPQLAVAEFATIVDASSPVVVERRMSWDARAYGAHAETSIAAPSSKWFLAEGATTGNFQLFYLLENPWSSPVPVRVSFLRPAPAEPFSQDYVLEPHSRLSVWVNWVDPRLAATDVSAVVESPVDLPIVVERAMYLSSRRQFEGGHASAGITTPSPDWFLAEGATGTYFDMYVLIANPSRADTTAHVDYLLSDGTSISRDYFVAAGSRYTIGVDQEDPRLANAELSVVVRTTNGTPIVVERAMWWSSTGAEWTEGHNSPGTTSAGPKWAVGDVRVGGVQRYETYVLVANTSYFPVTVDATLVLDDGRSFTRPIDVLARSRYTIAVAAVFPEAIGHVGSMLIHDPGNGAALVVESAVYSDAGPEHWAAGTNTLATRLR